MLSDDRSNAPRLPNFVIPAAMKSGTSSLMSALNGHPDAYCHKEPHFFCEHFDEGVSWYAEQFHSAGSVRAVGDKCPDYLYAPNALERMSKVLPEAKIILMLRNPVDRAYSHYWHERRLGRETLSFPDALESESTRIRKGEWGLAYLDMGQYAPQLDRVVASYPKESIKVVLFEEFKADPGAAFGEVCRFLGIDDSLRPATLSQRHNAYRRQRFSRLFFAMKKRRLFARLPRRVAGPVHRFMVQSAEYPPMEDGIRVQLNAAFASSNKALSKWLGRDRMPWDKTAKEAQ